MGAAIPKLSRFPSRTFFLVLFLILSHTSRAQRPAGSISDSVRTFLIPENLKHFLGLGMAIVERGQDDFLFSYGYGDSDETRYFTDSSVFNLGSVSKLFTAMAVMKLVEMDLIRLDDPVYKYFPEFLLIKGKQRYAAGITIAHLLQHRSGITQSMEDMYPELFDKSVLKNEDEFYENTYNYRAFLTRENFKERFMMHARLDDVPGKRYHFSNLAYVILGYIVEDITNVNLGQFVTDKFFTPLGMEETHYYRTPDAQEPEIAYGYYRLSDGSYLNVHQNEVESPSPTGDGGIRTTLRDMARFMKFLVSDPEHQDLYNSILKRTSLLSMTPPLAKGPDKTTFVGLGFHNLQPYNFTGHAGGWDGFLCILYYHPDSHSCFFTVTNREDNRLFTFLTVYSAYAMLHIRN